MSDHDLPLSQDAHGDEPVRPVAPTPPRVPGYEVGQLLGQGGMGTVWRAIETTTKRPVALKVLSLPLASAHARARFEREIELASRLSDPHIVRVYHSGLGEGFLYYTMELVEGEHLDRYVRRQQLDLPQIVPLVRAVCLAVHHAHQRGVLHRDLKPSNILVSADGQPHILDFGLAKALEDSAPCVTVTREGAIAGTLAYMAPEQAAGLRDQIDIRADVYSLGVVLFHLLTGQWPHDITQSHYQQQRAIVEGELRRPRQVDPTIPRELETILLKALEKQPAQRYGSAGDLAEDLRRYLDHEVLLARPLTGGYFLRKWVAKHRAGVLAGTMVFLLLAVMAGYAYVRIAQEKTLALAQADAARRALYLKGISLAESELQQENLGAAQVALNQCLPAYRQWEWYRLRYLADQSVRTLGPLPAYTQTMTVAPGGREIITANRDQGLAYWNPDDGKLLRQTPLPGPANNRVLLSPDGQVLACVNDHGLVLRHAATGEEITRSALPRTSTNQWLYSPAGARLATFAKPSQLTTWEAATGRLVSSQAIAEADRLLALGDDGQALFSAAAGLVLMEPDGQVRPLPATFSVYTGLAASLVMMDERPALLLVTNAGVIQCWDPHALTLQWELPGTVGNGGRLFWNQARHWLAYCDTQGIIQIWDVATRRSLGTYQGHAAWSSLYFHWLGDDGGFVTMGGGHEIKIWRGDRALETHLAWETKSRQPLLYVRGTDDGVVAANTTAGNILVWPRPGAEPLSLPTQSGLINMFCLTPKGEEIIVADQDGALSTWDTATRQLLRTSAGIGAAVTNLACDPQARWIVATYRQTSPGPLESRVWDRQGRQLAALPVRDPLGFNQDGSLLLACTADGLGLRLLATDHWVAVGDDSALHFASPIAAIAAATQCDLAVVAEQSGAVHVLDLAQRRVLRTWTPYPNQSVTAVALTPNGQRVALVGAGKLTLWDTASGTMVLDLTGSHRIVAMGVTFTCQGRRLLVDDRRQVLGWEIAP